MRKCTAPKNDTASGWSIKAAFLIIRFRWAVVGISLVLLVLAISAAKTLSVSTKLEALMPEGANSVINLQKALKKTGSFASIQVIVEGDNKAQIEDALFIMEAVVRRLSWSESAQYFEDISKLEEHKLLSLEVNELEEVEHKLEQEMLGSFTKEFQKETGIPIKINLMEKGISAQSSSDGTKQSSQDGLDIRAELLKPVETQKRFVSDDGRAQALVIWPRPGYEGLAHAKSMIDDVASIIQALDLNNPEMGLKVGIAGRVRNKVSQFDAVINDVKVGLISSISLILLLLACYYRRFIALPLIILPLAIGIAWTIGLTAVVIGGLNLITIFLALILFGLGIDFGIHNFSRYMEARASNLQHLDAIAIIVGQTGRASIIAGLTSSIGFLALTLTEFRAFREFGFIAGSGILLIFLAMYTVFPAFLSVVEKHVNWHPKNNSGPGKEVSVAMAVLRRPGKMVAAIFVAAAIGSAFVPFVGFEKNFKNIQAAKSDDHLWAASTSKNIFKGGHDRAVLVVDTLDEVKKIEEYFRSYTEQDVETPTIAQVTSIRSFVPDESAQQERLAVINRMWAQTGQGETIPTELANASRYLNIDLLKSDDLPPGMKRVFLGNESEPGYLVYIYNSVTMDDADLARQFYDDAAQFTVDGKSYYPASEGFVFVEMLALMKADAIRAIALVAGATFLIIFLFLRSLAAAAIVLLPTLIGLTLTLAVMTLIDMPLSIINMVILPSIIGISVDNGVHIFSRFHEGRESLSAVMATTGRAASITTMTTLFGFGGLITASMGGLRSMGGLAIIGFSLCLILTWTLLPALLGLLEHKFNGGDAAAVES